MILGFSLHDLDVQFTGWANGLLWPVEPLMRLALAGVLGALVGLEREIRGRQAGFRTNLLVALGCALVMIVSISFVYHPWSHATNVNVNVDPARVAYGVMSGIGFLGAGVIIKHDGAIRGLTTAAGLWCVAAIGLACGLGLYFIAVMAALIVLGVLWFLDHLERLLPKVRYRSLVLRLAWKPGVIHETVQMVKSHQVDVRDTSFHRLGDDLERVDLHLRIAFGSKRHYAEFEAKLARRDDCQLVSASSES